MREVQFQGEKDADRVIFSDGYSYERMLTFQAPSWLEAHRVYRWATDGGQEQPEPALLDWEEVKLRAHLEASHAVQEEARPGPGEV
jgi:hypothetical protein